MMMMLTMALAVPSCHRHLHRIRIVFFLLLTTATLSMGGPLHREFLYPNFTASNLLYVDTSGTFLTSPDSTFEASIRRPNPNDDRHRLSSFYLCIVHAPTSTLVWAANRASPVSDGDVLTLSASSLSLSTVWSTPHLPRPISALRLLDSGNLLLLDSSNRTLWQTFDNPTDTLLSGQRLPAGASLTASLSDSDLSPGDYHLTVTDNDLQLRWKGQRQQQYWSMAADIRAFRNSNAALRYAELNASGLVVFSQGGLPALVAPLPKADLRIAKFDTTGRFIIKSYVFTGKAAATVEFTAPQRNCELPFFCGSLGLCSDGPNNSSGCGCPAGFMPSAAPGCVPLDASLASSNGSCGRNSSSPLVTAYRRLPSGVGYFANKYDGPDMVGSNYSACRGGCTSDCSCLGFYFRNSTGSCFLLKEELGSLFAATGNDGGMVGYVKVFSSLPSSSSGSTLPRMLAIMIPLVATVAILFLLLLFLLCRKRASRRTDHQAEWKRNSWLREEEWHGGVSDDDDGEIFIPGLPTRFSYEELAVATEGFKDQIGSGGFGVVYKGVLSDNRKIAVKKLSNIGSRGKKDFCTEIAIISQIHHVNLVNLYGFCAHGSRCLLVYEYMNRGSLDRLLFSGYGRPVMEWQERVDVALGAARGLAYLHGGCDFKIIHCDVKPENILLHDHNGVKISDFGLSKLLTPEQSWSMTTMRGTRGYLAPEWLSNTPISERTDVYSFGMVLLEIVHGRKNCVQSTNVHVEMRTSDADAVTWTGDTLSTMGGESYFPLVALEKHVENRYEDLIDPRLTGRVTAAEVERVVKVALCCLHEEPARRPSMAMVVGMLEGTIPIVEPRLESLNFLKFYGRQSTEDSDAIGMTASIMNMQWHEVGNSTIPMPRIKGQATASIAAPHSCVSSQEVSGPR